MCVREDLRMMSGKYHRMHEISAPFLSHGEVELVDPWTSPISRSIHRNHSRFDAANYRQFRSPVEMFPDSVKADLPDVNVLRINKSGLTELHLPAELLGIRKTLRKLAGLVQATSFHSKVRCYLTIRNGSRFNRPLDFHSDGFQNGQVGVSENEFSFIYSSCSPTLFCEHGGVDIRHVDCLKYDVNDIFSRSVRSRHVNAMQPNMWYFTTPYCIHAAPRNVGRSRLFIRMSFVFKDATAGVFHDNPMLSDLVLPARRPDIRNSLSRLRNINGCKI